EAALARELEEELGIRIEVGAPLVTVPHLAPSRHLRLDVRHVAAWRGSAKGLEGQALAWVQPHKLPRYDMPAPDRPVVAALLQPDHCLVTPPPEQGEAAWLSALEAALARGVRRVQLRLPGVEPEVRRRLLEGATQRCASAGAELLVNGDIAIAREAGLGLHLPAARLRECGSRPVPPDRLFSASCHDSDELAPAVALGFDFVLVGPVHATPSPPAQAGIRWHRLSPLPPASTRPPAAPAPTPCTLSPRCRSTRSAAWVRTTSPSRASTAPRASPRSAASGTRRPPWPPAHPCRGGFGRDHFLAPPAGDDAQALTPAARARRRAAGLRGRGWSRAYRGGGVAAARAR